MTSSDAMVISHRAIDRDVQRVDLALAARMLELPHPLLAGGVDVERVVGHAREVEVEPRAPDEDADEDDGRNRRST